MITLHVLVTGGAGYIGSITVRRLLDEGHHVTALDTLERGNIEAIDDRARFIQGSVGDSQSVVTALQGCDGVVHCAGLIEVAESQTYPERYWRTNVVEPLELLRLMAEQNVNALVFSSTAAVYGEPESVPISETARLEPINTYGATKLAFEHAIASYERSNDLKAVRLRYFNVAGAWPDGSLGEAHDPETHIVPRILGMLAEGADTFTVFGDDYPTRDGTCVRDYIHVYDLAQAHIRALEYAVSGGSGVFNLGSGEGFTNLEVVQGCARVTDRSIEVAVGPRRPGDPAKLVASSEAARAQLGWVPERAELDTILADAWRWHLAHPLGYHSA